MLMMGLEAFLEHFGKAVKPKMNMSIYRDSFHCACGQAHWFDEGIDILCEGLMKVIVVCPHDPAYLTSLKIKTFMVIKFKGFDSLAGTRITNQNEKDAMHYLRLTLERIR